jgi:hypothetical protein
LISYEENKLECFVSLDMKDFPRTKHSNLQAYFQVTKTMKCCEYDSVDLYNKTSYWWHLTSYWLAMTNVPAYYDTESIMAAQYFIVHAPGGQTNRP